MEDLHADQDERAPAAPQCFPARAPLAANPAAADATAPRRPRQGFRTCCTIVAWVGAVPACAYLALSCATVLLSDAVPGVAQARRLIDPAGVAAQRLASAHAVSQQALFSVDHYIAEHEELPASLAEAGFTLPTHPSIERVDIQPETGLMVVRLKAPHDDLALVYARVAGEDDLPEWTCNGGPQVEHALLPPGCTGVEQHATSPSADDD